MKTISKIYTINKKMVIIAKTTTPTIVRHREPFTGKYVSRHKYDWDAIETELLLMYKFKQKRTYKEISNFLGRSIGAINARLYFINKVFKKYNIEYNKDTNYSLLVDLVKTEIAKSVNNVFVK